MTVFHMFLNETISVIDFSIKLFFFYVSCSNVDNLQRLNKDNVFYSICVIRVLPGALWKSLHIVIKTANKIKTNKIEL